jgi:hypothetical protein
MSDFIVLTGDAIEGARLASIEGRLRLELGGIRFRGGSTFAFVKRTWGFKGARPAVLAQFQEMRRAWNTAHGFGHVNSDTAAVPRTGERS